MRIAIVGSRNYSDLERVREYVRSLPTGTVVVSGGAIGVDKAAEFQARRCGLEVEIFIPEWNVYGKSAGFRRNKQIVDAADEVTAFWDGRSKGTLSTIHLAREAGKPVNIILLRPNEE